uniref:glucuronosyltransferase n=1 Tax=Steinernema glaseri TaxID=37863 RepID=A0A1I7ZEK7_9BILA
MLLRLCAVLSLLASASSLNVLMYGPTLAHSHVTFMGKIADILIDGGHNVTILNAILDPDVTVVGTPRATTIRYTGKSVDYPVFATLSSKTSEVFDVNRKGVNELPKLTQMLTVLCKDILEDSQFLQTLKDQKFDLGMTEFYEYCGDGLFEVLGIEKQIMVSAFPMFEPTHRAFGLRSTPSYIPQLFTPLSDVMTYRQRAINLLVSYKIDELFDSVMHDQTELFGGHFRNKESLLSLRRRKTGAAFINADVNLEFAQPITHKIHYVGGLKPARKQPLSDEFTKIVEKAKKGFVIFSFGTFAKSSTFPNEIRESLLKAFAKFPDYEFIWKYKESDEEAQSSHHVPNVHSFAWLPQNDLLNHPKCKLFITHGGYNGILESVEAGVPSVSVPLLGDQPHNVAVLVARKISRLLGKENLNEEGMTAALREVLTDTPSIYHKNVRVIAEKMKRRLIRPEEVILKTTEFVGDFGALEEWTLASVNHSFISLYMLDIFVPLVISIILICLVLLKVLIFCARKLRHFLVYKPKTD